MPKPKYQIISPDEVQPGDIHKFTPTTGSPKYHIVVEVRGDFAGIKTTYKGNETKMYTKKSTPQTTYGRLVKNEATRLRT